MELVKVMNLLQIFTLLALLAGSDLVAMDMPLPSQEQLKAMQDLWTQSKQRIAVIKELKSRFAQKQNIVLQPMPSNITTQSLAHLIATFGAGKTQETYISKATRQPNYPDNYYEMMKMLGDQYREQANEIINNEKRYWNYDVFYHGQENALVLINDIMRAIYGWLDLETPDAQTRFFRLLVQNNTEKTTVDEYLKPLKKELSTTKYFDHITHVRDNLLATNLSLFGNIDLNTESSWNYYVSGISLAPPTYRTQLTEFFKLFNFNEKFIEQILDIHRTYLEKTATILPSQKKIAAGALSQIFIHPSLVDQLTYLSKEGGGLFVFADYVPSIRSTKTSSEKELINKQIAQLQKEVFDQKLGRLSVEKYLNLVKTQADQIPFSILNRAQAREYLKYSLLMNPEKVKIFIYKTPSINPVDTQKAEQLYKQSLEQTVEEIIKEWLFREKNTGTQKTKLEQFFEFLKNR